MLLSMDKLVRGPKISSTNEASPMTRSKSERVISPLSSMSKRLNNLKPTKNLWYYEFFEQNLRKIEKSKIDKFEILNPKSTQNLKSLTLVTKMQISLKKLLKSPIFSRNILKTAANRARWAPAALGEPRPKIPTTRSKDPLGIARCVKKCAGPKIQRNSILGPEFGPAFDQ